MMVEIYAVLGLLAFFVLILVIKTATVVPNRSAYIVERLGRFHTVLNAGFHILIPFIDRIAYRRSLKEQVLDVPKQTCITRDNVSVDIDGVLYLQVIAPDKSAYGVSDYIVASVQLAQTALRSAIGKLELDKTFEERNTINQEVIAALDVATAPWGIKVLRYEIRDITPPVSVMEAMEKQMRAEREKRAAIAQSEGEKQARINLAEGEKRAAIARSEGEKQTRINESEGIREALRNKAEGEAAQIRLVATATAEALKIVGQELSNPGGFDAARLRIAEDYLKRFGNLARKNNTMIIPANLADAGGMVAALTAVLEKSKGGR